MSEWGDFVTKRRIKLGYSLRSFCLKFGYDAGNLSKMERGLLLPPKGEKLEEMAKALELTPEPLTYWCINRDNIEAYYHFKELAEKERQPLLKEVCELKSQLTQKDKMITILKEALNRYAAESNWESVTYYEYYGDDDRVECESYILDHGQSARKALKEVEQLEQVEVKDK